MSGAKAAGREAAGRRVARRDIGNSIPAEELSHEPEVVAAYTSDPLNHHVATARWAADVLAAQSAALSRPGGFACRCSSLYAGADTIADPAASRELFAAPPPPTRPCCYEGYYHELFNEVGRDAVFADLGAWPRHGLRAAEPASAVAGVYPSRPARSIQPSMRPGSR